MTLGAFLPSWAGLGFAAALGAGLLWAAQSCDRRDADASARDRERIVADSVELAMRRAERARLDTLYRADTVTLRSVETRYRALRDTLTITDSFTVFRAFALADTVVRACRAALATAEGRLSACDSTAAALGRQRDAWRRIAERPGPRVQTSVGAAWDATAGAVQADAGVALRVVGRLSATASVQQTFAPSESPRLLFGARLTF